MLIDRVCCFLSQVQLLLDVLMKEVLHPESQSPNGLKFHLIDIYLDELSKVGGKEVSGGPPAVGRGHGQRAQVSARLRGPWELAVDCCLLPAITEHELAHPVFDTVLARLRMYPPQLRGHGFVP